MTTMRKKQNYIAPAVDILNFDTEGIIATSNTKVDVYGGEEGSDGNGGGEYGDADMSHKKDSWSHTWE